MEQIGLNEMINHLLEQEESEILEFKENNKDPERIGKYISALANSAAILGKQYSYMIWGVSDSKEVIGTNFFPYVSKKGNEPLISWLERNLDPKITIRFEETTYRTNHIVLLTIHMNAGRPVSFLGEKYIRSGSSVKSLKLFPEKERALWKSFDARNFEKEFSATNLTMQEVVDLLDVDAYKKMMNLPSEITIEELFVGMSDDGIIEQSMEKYNITNMGAYSFARDIRKFKSLMNHMLRVIVYEGKNRLQAIEDIQQTKGVASGFEEYLNTISLLLPKNAEQYLESGIRSPQTDYPVLAIRELVANQLVHQDFSIRGTSPIIEIFDDRVEIMNPGAPINDTDRLLDLPPISRNEDLANLFRKMHLVEARGSGIDKVLITLEINHLPAPDFSTKGDSLVVTLYKQKSIKEMSEKEQINAIFYHASLQLVENSYMTNSTIRERFNIPKTQSSLVSKLINLALNNGKIKLFDEEASRKYRQYIPYWAKTIKE